MQNGVKYKRLLFSHSLRKGAWRVFDREALSKEYTPS